ncbi:MAG: integrase arm-type DNA-binding domain-containing protein [Qipengyuania citrea]
MGRLTVTGVKAALNKPGRHRDGDGLMLYVRKPGQGTWVARIQHAGKRRDYGLGSVDHVSLSEARERAREYKKALLENRDPLALSRPPQGMTRLFRATAEEFLHAKFSEANKAVATARLKTFAYPQLGGLQLQSIDADTIAETLRPIWTTKPETARRVRDLITRTLRYGRPDGALLESTLARAITDRLPAQPKRGNFKSMPYQDVPALMIRLREKQGWGAIAVRFAILTATRSGEIRGAEHSEFELSKALWTIPAARMKAGKLHRVPLSAEAIDLVRPYFENQQAGTKLVFPAASGKPLSDMTLTKALRDLGEKATVHGFRSSFRDWAAEQTDFPREIAEAALAHAVPDAVEAAYRRTDFFDKRREMMDAWGNFLRGS